MSSNSNLPPTPEEPAAAATATESFGRFLHRERELRGMAVAQIAEQTRISVGHLKALEADDHARLPARVFVLGIIRSYARAIGIDGDDAVLRFEEECQRSQPAESPARTRRRNPRLRGRVLLGAAALIAAAAAAAWALLAS